MKTKSAIAIFIAFAVFLFWSSTRQKTHETAKPETSVESNKISKRRTRIGPKKPPASQSKTKNPASPSLPTPAEPEEEQESDEAIRKNDLEAKLQQYFEVLESINDPTPSELITLGELAFDANDSESAYEHYLEVIEEHPDDPMAPFALYKFAWVEFNLGDVNAALLDMELVVEWINTGEVAQNGILSRAAPEDLLFFEKKAKKDSSE